MNESFRKSCEGSLILAFCMQSGFWITLQLLAIGQRHRLWSKEETYTSKKNQCMQLKIFLLLSVQVFPLQKKASSQAAWWLLASAVGNCCKLQKFWLYMQYSPFFRSQPLATGGQVSSLLTYDLLCWVTPNLALLSCSILQSLETPVWPWL